MIDDLGRARLPARALRRGAPLGARSSSSSSVVCFVVGGGGGNTLMRKMRRPKASAIVARTKMKRRPKSCALSTSIRTLLIASITLICLCKSTQANNRFNESKSSPSSSLFLSPLTKPAAATTRGSTSGGSQFVQTRTDEPIDHWLPYQNPGPHLPSRTGPRRINNDNEPLSNAYDEDDSERSSSRRKVQMTRRTEIRSRPVRSLAVGSVSQPPPPPPPKLVQWSKEPVQYYEGSTLVLSCSSASASSANAPLRFNWLKSGKSLMQATGSAGNTHERLSIETLAEYSFLRLASLRPSDGGQYTCVASNSLGQEDRTSAQVIVNVKLKWLAKSVGVAAQTDSMQNERLNSSSARFQVMPNGNELHVARAGSSLVLECNASAQPRPRIRWFRWAPLGGASNGQSVAAHTQTAHSGSTIRQQQLSPSSSSSSTTTTNRQQLAHLGNVKLDEAQLRAALMQPTTTNSNANSNNNNYDDTDSMVAQLQMQTQLHRAELAPIGMTPNSASSSSLSLDAQTRNGSLRASGSSWRIETSSIGGAASSTTNEIHSRLVLERIDLGAGAIYECEASTDSSQSASSMSAQASLSAAPPLMNVERLRRLFGVLVNGKF